jgi:hypothetical protein
VGVQEAGAADAVLAAATQEGGDAGEGDVEALGLGELGGEEAELDLAGSAGLGAEVEGEDAGGGRMGLEIEVEELEEDLALEDGEGGLEGADVFAATIEAEGEGEAGEGQGSVAGAGEELVEHGAEDEEERIEELDGGVEGEELLEGEGGLFGNEEVGEFAAGEETEALAGLAEADDELDFWEGGELAEGCEAPEGESFGLGRGEREGGEREIVQEFFFFCGRDENGGSGGGRGEADGGVDVGAGGEAGGEVEGRQSAGEAGEGFLRGAEEEGGSGHVQDHDEGGGGG